MADQYDGECILMVLVSLDHGLSSDCELLLWQNPQQKALLVREKISTQAQLSSGAATNLSPQVRDRMHQSCELLDSVGELIDLDEKSKPIRVMGFPAEPPAVTGVVTVVLLAFTFLSEGLLAGEIQFVGGEEGSQSV